MLNQRRFKLGVQERQLREICRLRLLQQPQPTAEVSVSLRQTRLDGAPHLVEAKGEVMQVTA